MLMTNKKDEYNEAETQFISVCDCHSPEHDLRINTSLHEDYNEVYISIYLSEEGKTLWDRIRYAWNYILGKKTTYGAWGCWTCNNPEEMREIANIFNKIAAIEEKRLLEETDTTTKQRKDK